MIEKCFKISRLLLSLLLVVLLSWSCQKEPELDPVKFEHYTRVVGKAGGKVRFYDDYNDDSSRELAVELDIPQGALNKSVIINMFYFGNARLTDALANLGIAYVHDELFVDESLMAISDWGDPDQFNEMVKSLFYFIPIDEELGFHSGSITDSTRFQHLSVKFSKPATLGFQVNFTDLWSEEDISKRVKLYRVKIPAYGEWFDDEDNNVWISYNKEGYVDGFLDEDISQLLDGRFNKEDGWGNEDVSLTNWEEVENYQMVKRATRMVDGVPLHFYWVTTEVMDLDHIYFFARTGGWDYEMPAKMVNYVTQNYPNTAITYLDTIDDFDKPFYYAELKTSPITTLYFNENQDFIASYADHENQELPPDIIYYLMTKHANAENVLITRNKDKQTATTTYEADVSSSGSLLNQIIFDEDGYMMNDYRYVSLTELPSDLQTFLATNLSHMAPPEVSTAFLMYDSQYGSHDFDEGYLIKYYYEGSMGFDTLGLESYHIHILTLDWSKNTDEYNFTIKAQDLNSFDAEKIIPPKALEYLNSNLSGAWWIEDAYIYKDVFNPVANTILYEFELESGMTFVFNSSGAIEWMWALNVPVQVLPAPLLNFVNQRFSGTSITNIQIADWNGDLIYDIQLTIPGEDNPLQLWFDNTGDFMEMFPAEHAIVYIPLELVDTVIHDYPGHKIDQKNSRVLLSSDATKTFYIVLDDGTELYYNRNFEEIAVNENLPPAANTYITTHYPMSLVDSHGIMFEADKLFYVVWLNTFETLYFKENGDYAGVEKEITRLELPVATQNYLVANYPETNFTYISSSVSERSWIAPPLSKVYGVTYMDEKNGWEITAYFDESGAFLYQW